MPSVRGGPDVSEEKGMAVVRVAELPVFVQNRAYDKGLEVVRIVFDPSRRFGTTPVFEGTRQSPEDIAGELESGASPDRIAWLSDLTVRQVEAARNWLAAHPYCDVCGGTGERRRRKCRACDGLGRAYSDEEKQAIADSAAETERIWATMPTPARVPSEEGDLATSETDRGDRAS
jgi:uncharacterized protein (DUF433 family)